MSNDEFDLGFDKPLRSNTTWSQISHSFRKDTTAGGSFALSPKNPAQTYAVVDIQLAIRRRRTSETRQSLIPSER